MIGNKHLTEEEDIQKAFRLAEYIKNGRLLFKPPNRSLIPFRQKRLLYTLYGNIDT